jgi:hypothetical protein
VATEVLFTDEFGAFGSFVPRRMGIQGAVLLIGGDKTGDDRFYERVVPIAEKIWTSYLEETGQKKPKKKK